MSDRTAAVILDSLAGSVVTVDSEGRITPPTGRRSV